MFIELTDHLRCTEPHDEQFLVLLPELLSGRRVIRGDLGCPVCGKVVRLEEGVADFGGGVAATGPPGLTAEAIASFLGLTGAGGYVALVGAIGGIADSLRALHPGIRFVLVNPPADTLDSEPASVLRAGRLPLKGGSMRGVVVGGDLAADRSWVADAVRAVLPGLRVVVDGGEPPEDAVELLGRTEGCWVGKRRDPLAGR